MSRKTKSDRQKEADRLFELCADITVRLAVGGKAIGNHRIKLEKAMKGLRDFEDFLNDPCAVRGTFGTSVERAPFLADIRGDVEKFKSRMENHKKKQRQKKPGKQGSMVKFEFKFPRFKRNAKTSTRGKVAVTLMSLTKQIYGEGKPTKVAEYMGRDENVSLLGPALDIKSIDKYYDRHRPENETEMMNDKNAPFRHFLSDSKPKKK